jgi:coenzyme PQQ synthesis protein D (PqqD)
MNEKYVARRGQHIASRLLNGEMMMMSTSDSTVFNLNVVAALIWQAADGRTPLSEIVRDRICTEFDVPMDVAYRDAEAFVKELAAHGILMVLDRPVADPGSGAGAKS